jgi:hypothetical protein
MTRPAIPLQAEALKDYDCTDVSPFAPSAAIYFMNGYSDATVRVYTTDEKMTFRWWDQATSIAASAPLTRGVHNMEEGAFLVAPRPLHSKAAFPSGMPGPYHKARTLQLLQVISMNMRSKDGKSSLLIGFPYANKYPSVFFGGGFADDATDASSYGLVASLTDFERENGYPARSCFAVYHILETEMGVFFNKKPTVMELQPSENGKLALTLPPIPFKYELINGPIPLYDIRNPEGAPVAEVVAAHHHDNGASRAPEKSAWPWNQ